MILNDLPPEHPLRNAPLRDINAECCNVHAKDKTWREVKKWYIGRCTFNQLSPDVWHANNLFRVAGE